MHRVGRTALLLTCLLYAGWLAAQTATLPPGTTSPDANLAKPSSSDAAALVSKAEEDIVNGQPSQALSLLKQALALAPANSSQAARALYDRGYVEQERHQDTDAKADFRKAILADPKQFESHAALGRMLAQHEQWTAARRELQLAAALQPASGNRAQAIADVDRTLARVDAQLHDTGSASEALLAALKLTSERPDDTFLAAQLAEDQENYPGAEQEYRKALTADPKSIPAAEGLARVLIQQGKFAEAEPVLQQALQQEANDPVLLAESATALAGQGKTQAAIAQLESLHRQNPNQPAVTRMLADLYSTAGQADKAGPLYQNLIGSDRKNPSLLTAAGENMIREQKWLDAVETLQQSLALQPAQGDAWSGVAFAAFQNGQYPLVLTALDQRAQYAADGPATLFLRAAALDRMHHTKQAIPYYRKFLSEAQGRFPTEESQTRQRLKDLRNSH